MRVSLLVALAFLATVLQGCAESTPLWGPASPRNGAGDVVDPQGGFVIPGYPSGNRR